jgi:hypothetical protein
LQEQSSREERELAKLRSALRETEGHSNELMVADTRSGGEVTRTLATTRHSEHPASRR